MRSPFTHPKTMAALVVASLLTALPWATAAAMAPAASAAAATSTVALPPANGVFDYQLGGAYSPGTTAAIIDRDRTDEPVQGRYNVCYVNAFQTQPGESASFLKAHPNLLVKGSNGKPLVDPGWPDEYLFDISTAAKRTQLIAIVGRWIDGCASDGFQAIEADNLDSYTRSQNRLTRDNAIAFAKLLVQRAHSAGLAIGQKNAADLATTGKKTLGFDFAVAEECQVYAECGSYTRAYGTQVYEIEYTDNGSNAYPAACAAQGKTISVIYRDRDVVPRGDPDYVYRSC